MKNKKSLIILSGSILIVFVFAIVRMTYSNTVLSDTRFPDQNFYKCLVEIIGESKINSDGTIPDNILTTLIMLNCPSKEISSVKGIELLTNLEYSDLEQNNITEIDLTNNIKLKYLSLSYNQLTNIDLSKNTKLENLYLQQNKLTTVNISNQPELLFLTIANNQLSSINLSNNLKLKILYLFDNQLTSINISNNSKLTDLTLSENQLTNIDLSNNLELQRLYLDDNQLTNINVNNLPELIALQLNNNKLSNLDLSNNSKLEHLAVSDNYFNSLNLENLDNLKMHDTFGTAKLNTTINNYAPNISKTVYNRENIVVTEGNVGTGFKVVKGNLEYYLVIPGDVTGDGEISVNDISKAYQYLKGNAYLNDYDRNAANVSNSNSNITVADISKMYQYLKGKISSLE